MDELEDMTCKEKDSRVELACRYSNAAIKLRWFKGALEIFHGHKYNFLNDDGILRLIIHRVVMEDEGKYTCQADDKSTSAFLTVEGIALFAFRTV